MYVLETGRCCIRGWMYVCMVPKYGDDSCTCISLINRSRWCSPSWSSSCRRPTCCARDTRRCRRRLAWRGQSPSWTLIRLFRDNIRSPGKEDEKFNFSLKPFDLPFLFSLSNFETGNSINYKRILFDARSIKVELFFSVTLKTVTSFQICIL